jgi:nitroreductase
MNRRQLVLAGGTVAALGLGATALTMTGTGTMEEYAAAAEVLRARLTERPALPEIVRAATLAASGHNTQPWRFRLGASRIDLLSDTSRRTPVVDPDDHHLFASLGCAAVNLEIAARAAGHLGDLRFDTAGEGAILFEFEDGQPEISPLLPAIIQRQSTRAEFDGRALGSGELDTLLAASRVAGVELILITDRARIEHVSDLIVAGNTAQMADAAFVRELKDWIRFSPRRAAETGDGLFGASSGNPALPDWLGALMFDFVFKPQSENEKYARQLRSSSGVAVFVSERNDPEHWAKAGRSCQRFALQATALGLKHAFVNQPVEVPEVRAQLASWLGVGDRRPDLVMRFGYGPDMPRSFRRPVADVIVDASAGPA